MITNGGTIHKMVNTVDIKWPPRFSAGLNMWNIWGLAVEGPLPILGFAKDLFVPATLFLLSPVFSVVGLLGISSLMFA